MDNTDKLRILIFDLDGVITSEKKYWNTARLTVWELMSSQEYLGLTNYFGPVNELSQILPEMGEQVIPSEFIYELKSRAINSNWDLTFFVFCLHLVGILTELNQADPEGWREILDNENAPIWENLQQLGGTLRDRGYTAQISEGTIAEFWQETESLTGNAVLEYLGEFIDRRLGVNVPALAQKGDLWQLCYGNFQEWYEGEKDYQLPDDETVLELSEIEATLKQLYGRYSLAIATGRPRTEAIEPLQVLGLLEYFDSKRIVTYDEVLAAESIMSQKGERVKLGKPHPFVVLKAMDPYINMETLCSSEYQQSDHKYVAYIGDAASDVVAAKGAGCMAIGVLTGFATGEAIENKRRQFVELGCDAILNSIVELPEWLEHRSRSLTQEDSATEEVSSTLPEITQEDSSPLPELTQEDSATEEVSSTLPEITQEGSSPLPEITQEDSVTEEVSSTLPEITQEDSSPLPEITQEDSSPLPEITQEDSATEEVSSTLPELTQEDSVTEEVSSTLPELTQEDSSPLPEITQEGSSPLPEITQEDSATEEVSSTLPELTQEDSSPLPESTQEDSSPLPESTQEVSATEEVKTALPQKEPDLLTNGLGKRKDMVNQHVKSLNPKVAGPPKADNAIRLDKGELPYPPSRRVIEAIASAARTINRYPDILGGELRGALAKYTKAKPEQIIIGNGSDDLIELIVKTFVQPGEEVLLPVPTFFVYGSSTEIINARPVFVQRTADFGLDVEALLQKVTPQTKVIFIANPNNPTANLVARETIIQILERAECMVVVDECYYEICQETVADLVDKYPHLIVLRSFSKSFGLAGLRVGYAIANEVIVDYLYRAAQLFPVGKLALVGAIAALEEISYVEANLDQIRRERGKLAKALQQLGFIVYPSATNFLFVRTEPLGIKSKDLVAALQSKNIFVADFGGKPGLDEYYFRTAVGTRTENQRLLNGLISAIG
ncbi:MAG: histidinol-phosphate transaminase [Hormoscilla sp.]